MTDLKRMLDEAQTDEPWTVVWYGDERLPAIAIHRSTEDRICFMPTIRHPADGVQFEANAALIVAAVNAVPELLALREEVVRLREQVRELSDCQRLPKVYRYTGTAEVDVENMFDVGHRHRSGKQPRDYLMSWLSMFRPFAYATKDDSWGELEKLISIVMNNYVQILVRAEKARAALNQEPGQ